MERGRLARRGAGATRGLGHIGHEGVLGAGGGGGGGGLAFGGGVLADRREAVRLWEEIVRLAGEVKCRDKATESYILTSALYGLRLFRMVEAGWDVMATGLEGDLLGRAHDTARLRSAIERYDRAKADYMRLPAERPDAATLFTDNYVRIGGVSKNNAKVAVPIPGLGESVDRYRNAVN